jgi:hypothetical protein
LVTNSSTVAAVIARHFATRDGTMRASNAILAFGLLVASATTVHGAFLNPRASPQFD